VRKTLSRERMAREMELAHDLQMKLLPDPSEVPAAEAAGRVVPTEQVGGDFYQLFDLLGRSRGRHARRRVAARLSPPRSS
jgi:serine phosphatase RsbU (regulator of sigma subunit)